jgi:ATP-dependent Clp protease ATP-binding subunit ClpC
MGIGGTNLQSRRFTARVQRVLQYACQEAARRDAGAVGTLHLLAGIVREGHGLLARVFAKWHLSGEALGAQLGMIWPGPAEFCGEELAPDLEMEMVLIFAAEEADQQGRWEIANEHLLLGILRADDSVAGKLLAAHGLSADAVRAQIKVIRSDALARLPPEV